MNFIKTTTGGITIDIYVSPKSAKNIIKGIRNNRLWIAIKAVPQDGKANEELINFMSKTFGITKSNISIISGSTGRNKRVMIKNSSIDYIVSKFQSII